MRWTICSTDISREKRATPAPPTTAAWRATLAAKALLPTDGRAATMIRSAACVQRRRARVGQGGDGGRAADEPQLAGRLELRRDRDEVGRLPAFVEGDNRFVDAAVARAVEVAGLQERRDRDDRLGIDEQGA